MCVLEQDPVGKEQLRIQFDHGLHTSLVTAMKSRIDSEAECLGIGHYYSLASDDESGDVYKTV